MCLKYQIKCPLCLIHYEIYPQDYFTVFKVELIKIQLATPVVRRVMIWIIFLAFNLAVLKEHIPVTIAAKEK